jgi:flagellin
MEGFRINNNVNALVANGNLRQHQLGLSKSIERLSSGLRINRGADDAAGLTVSEKLRAQITGLERGIGNAQDATSLIQTAEGALNEDHAILNRMRELSIQAQSDALTSGDRLEIQKEVDQLVSEIDRIAETTEFNTKKALDGSMAALVSTDHSDLVAYQTGEKTITGGDYTVKVTKEESGVRQIQNSAIQRDSDSGNVASLSTKLGKLESMTDLSGNSRLDSPETLVLKGNEQTTEVIMSSDQTLEEFTLKVEEAIAKDSADGGLGMTGATFAYNATSGQFIFEASREGAIGELSFGGDDGILKALAMQETVESEDAAFKVTAKSVGLATATTVSENTTNGRATGVLAGIDLQFELSSEARHDGTIAASEAITVSTNDVVFTFFDTNASTTEDDASEDLVGAGNKSAGVTITLTASRTYTTASISTMINNAVSAANDGGNALTVAANTSSNMQNPGISASFDGYNLVLTSSATGSTGEISIAGNQAAQDILGIVDGKTTGSGGETAVLLGTIDISQGITINGTGTLELQVGDGDFNINQGSTGSGSGMSDTIANGGNIQFNRGVAISATSVVNTFNTYFSANNIKAEATQTSDGKLEIRSTETGTDSKVSISVAAADPTGSLANLGFVNGQNDVGQGGNAAVLTGITNDAQETHAFTFAETFRFQVTDKNGAQTNSIQIGTTSVNLTGESFSISKEAVTSILNGSNLSTTDVDFGIDAGNRLDFFSRSTGEESRVVLTTGNNATYQSISRNGFGMDFESSDQGEGKTDFNVHVTDKTLRFEVGANKQQFMSFQVRSATSDSLGLRGTDVTNIDAATRALGKIDDAIQAVSSERSKLGSVQNRLASTINNQTVTKANLAGFESSIRDVDLAKETVEFTRNQILSQAGTAQLAQAKALPQGGLQLLG